MNHIEKTKHLVDNGMVSVVNPQYLCALTEQQERSMYGQRTMFLEFHRYIFSLNDQNIYKIWDKYREEFRKASIENPSDSFCDLNLLCDAIQFQISIRDDKQATPEIAEEIAMSWQENCNLAKNFEDITSEHLIDVVKRWLND